MSRDPHDTAPALADDALLTPFRESTDPVLTTDEVCDRVALGRGPTEEGLDRLVGEGVLERKPVGEGTVWWLPGYTETEAHRGPMPGATRESGGLPQPVENAISTLDAPDERERAAVYAVCYYLLERDSASPETLREEVYPDHDAGYDDAAEWWNGAVRPALAALPNVTCENGEWRLG